MFFDPRDAYQGVESFENFSSDEALDRYRRSCLIKSQKECRFLDRYLKSSGKILEIACGNGRTLIELIRNNRVTYGLGIDVSASRVEFAKKWASDLKIKDNLDFLMTDVFSFPKLNYRFDTTLCIQSAMGILAPVTDNGDLKVLRWIKENSSVGAHLIIELYKYKNDIRNCRNTNGNKTQTWAELPEDDPFRFYLNEKSWDEKTKTLHTKKIFISRSGGIDEGRNESQRIYSVEDATSLIKESGLELQEIYGNWDGKRHENDDNQMIIVAEVV